MRSAPSCQKLCKSTVPEKGTPTIFQLGRSRLDVLNEKVYVGPTSKGMAPSWRRRLRAALSSRSSRSKVASVPSGGGASPAGVTNIRSAAIMRFETMCGRSALCEGFPNE